MQPYEFISDHTKVIDVFRQWPSFHDGEVHRLVLDRMSKNESGAFIPVVEIHLRGWIMTSEVTDAGFYEREHDSVVHLRFDDVFELELDGMNHQNVLSCLNLDWFVDPTGVSPALHVELEHCYGLSGSFNARRAQVLSVVPFFGSSES